MVKKLKAMAEGRSDNQLAAAVRESAQQIWLAGLGAFSKAQEEGGKVFSALVNEGMGLQKRTRSAAVEGVESVSERVSKAADGLSRQASESWDRLEQVFEERVDRALGRLGVPRNSDIQELIKRVDSLHRAVQGGPERGATGRASAGKAGVKKAGAKKAGAKKAGATTAASKAASAAGSGAKKAGAKKAGAKKARAGAAKRRGAATRASAKKVGASGAAAA
ncbi:MAG: phasin family protein [Burkholderiales bacterium]|nr:MAG: phasin family protein [Burkholderiales bacterium]